MSIVAIAAIALVASGAPAPAWAAPIVTRPVAELFGSRPGYGSAGAGVNTATGNFTRNWTDLTAGSLTFRRTYNSLNTADSPLGAGWTTSYSARVTEAEDGSVALHDEDGRVLTFAPDGAGGFRTPQDLEAELTRDAAGLFVLRTFAGDERSYFDAAGLLTQRTREGQRLTVTRDPDARPSKVEHSAGYSLAFTYDADGRLTKVAAGDGRAVGYGYAADDTLATVTATDGADSKYAFDSGLLRELEDAEGRRLLTNTYDDGRVTRQDLTSGGVLFAYDAEAGTTTATATTDRAVTTYQHDAAGRLIRVTDPAGNSAVQTFDANGRLTGVTTPGGRQTAVGYDGHGNVVRSEFGGAVSTFGYDAQDRLVTLTEPGQGVLRMAYSSVSRVPSEITAPDGSVTRATVADGLITESIDPAGAKTTYAYDEGRRLSAVTDPLDGVTRYEYDDAGRRTGTVSPLGRAERDKLDPAGRITQRVEPSGATTKYGYSAAGLLQTTTDPIGAVYRNEYNGAGRLTATLDPLERRTRYTHDDDGRTATVTDAAGGVSTFGYDTLGRRNAVTYPDGTVTRYTYDADGQVTEVAEPAGTTVSGHDARGNVTSTTDALGRVTRYEFDVANRQVAKTDPTGAVWRTTYDVMGRTATETDPTGAVTRYEYDTAGRLAAVIDPRGNKTQYRYDAAGRQTQIIDPLGGVVKYAYDADGRRISETTPAGLVTRYKYDADGHVTQITDPRGGLHKFRFSDRGEEIAQVRPDGAVHELKYDAAGQLVTTVDANGGRTKYAYDGGGRLVTLTDAKGAKRTFGRDANGRERSFTDPLGRVTKREYDTSGRLSAVTDPAGGVSRWEYNAIGDVTRKVGTDGTTVTYAYDGARRRTAMTDPAGTTAYAYDAAGRLLSATGPDGGKLTMTYDPAGNQTSLQYPGGGRTTFRYNANNQLISLDSAAGRATYTLDADGRLVTEKLPDKWERRYGYTGDMLTRYQELRDGRYTRDTRLTRDSDGLITAQVDGDDVLEYRYDAGDQLTAVRDGDGGDVLTAEYDEVGNRTSITRAGKTTALAYDAADQLLSATTGTHKVSYTYDAVGRQTGESDGKKARTIAYDGFGLPAVSTTTEGKLTETVLSTYDGDSLLTKVTASTRYDGHLTETRPTTTAYRWSVTDELPQILSQRVTGGGGGHDAAATTSCTPDADFVYGYGRALADSRCGDAVFSKDVFGSTLRTDDTEDWAQSSGYDPFGRPEDDRNGTRPTFGYRGELAQGSEVYLRARTYDSGTGRFTTRDPLSTRVGQTDIVTPYGYANNSPQDYVDPTGEFAIGLFGGFLSQFLDALIAALTQIRWDCPDAGNSPDQHTKCFQGVPLQTRGGYKGVEWALNGAEGPLSELWYDKHKQEYAARAFVVNYLSEERDNFFEELWDVFDKGLNENVDWEVGPKSGGMTQRPDGTWFFPTAHWIDLVTDEKEIYEVKIYDNGKRVGEVSDQLTRYLGYGHNEWGINWELGTELTDWADGFEVSRNYGFLGLRRESADVVVWGADAGHVYFDVEDNVDDAARAKIKAKKKGKWKNGGKGPKLPPRRR
ncbi:DUF6531 domain-containing protein [Actinoplanes sp. NPDC049668]|uniref:DUF6531 domain-containing protein n=1 Tax=unclassified Actinoplanes TaxID=2626549 RepID=UPI0033ABA5D1